jgi:hypothetical protein
MAEGEADMKRFAIAIARDLSEYATVTVEAETLEAAKDQVRRAFIAGALEHSKEYCDLANSVGWSIGGETENERILDVEEIEEEDENPREKGDDDGVEYGDPRDEREERD